MKRLNALISQLLPFLAQEHQQQVHQAVERAKQITVNELNAIIGVSEAADRWCQFEWYICTYFSGGWVFGWLVSKRVPVVCAAAAKNGEIFWGCVSKFIFHFVVPPMPPSSTTLSSSNTNKDSNS